MRSGWSSWNRGAHSPTGEHQFPSKGLRQQAGKAYGTVVGEHADTGLRKEELGVLGRHDQVGRHRDLEPAAHGHTVDGGDDRLVEVVAGGDTAEPGLGLAAHVAARRLVLQVVAGRERTVPGPGDDRDPQIGVGGELVERIGQLAAWTSPLYPLRDGSAIILRILRESGKPQALNAPLGTFQQMLGGKTAQMLRVRLEPGLACVPEISANKYVLNIRFLAQNGEDARARTADWDVGFELTFCNL